MYYKWNGEYRKVELPPLDVYECAQDIEDGYMVNPNWAVVDPGQSVSVTEAGWERVEESLGEAAMPLPDSLSHVRDLLRLGLHDTAVRELSVTLESEVRDLLGTNAYGHRLVEEFTAKLLADGWYEETASVYRLRLRTFFKFVRNEFAHQRVQLSQAQALALVAHVAMIIEDVRALRAGDDPWQVYEALRAAKKRT
jgi:hypothetical protein